MSIKLSLIALAIFTTLCVSPVFATFAEQSYSSTGKMFGVNGQFTIIPCGPNFCFSGTYAVTSSGGVHGTFDCTNIGVSYPNGDFKGYAQCQFAGTLIGGKGLGTAVLDSANVGGNNGLSIVSKGTWVSGSGTGGLTGLQGTYNFKGTSPSATSPITQGTYTDHHTF